MVPKHGDPMPAADRGTPERRLFSMANSDHLQLVQKRHYHEQYQIYYVRRGSLLHRVADHYVRLTEGDCFILPPYAEHRVELDQKTSGFISFTFFAEFLPPSALAGEEIQSLFAALTPMGLLGRLVLSAQEKKRMEELTAFGYERHIAGDADAVRNVLSAVLVLLSRVYRREKQDFKHSATLQPCLEYMNSQFHRRLTPGELAGRMYLSKATFYRTFTRLTGYSFKEYLTMIRIRHACLLLRDPEVPITRAAAQCGFGDYSAFYRAFSRQMGQSPVEYRRRYERFSREGGAFLHLKTNENEEDGSEDRSGKG